MSFFELYIFLVLLPGLHSAFGWFIVVFILLSVFSLLMLGAMSDTGDEEMVSNWWGKISQKFKTIFCFLLLFISLYTITPNQQTLMTIIGASYVSQIEGMSDLPPEIVKAAKNFIKTYSGDSE